MSNTAPVVEKRQFYRLRYPAGQGSRLIIDGVQYELTEISEAGVRFAHHASRFRVGAPVKALVHTLAGYQGEVEGRVLRVEPARRETILQLTSKRIPAAAIFGEERLVRTDQERRQSRRMRYPDGVSATLIVRSAMFPVIDIAEQGIKLRASRYAFRPDKPVAGTLRLVSGFRLAVGGEVIRIDAATREVVLRLGRHISSQVIADEQQYIAQRYKLQAQLSRVASL